VWLLQLLVLFLALVLLVLPFLLALLRLLLLLLLLLLHLLLPLPLLLATGRAPSASPGRAAEVSALSLPSLLHPAQSAAAAPSWGTGSAARHPAGPCCQQTGHTPLSLPVVS
jgi:hypothetical protein